MTGDCGGRRSSEREGLADGGRSTPLVGEDMPSKLSSGGRHFGSQIDGMFIITSFLGFGIYTHIRGLALVAGALRSGWCSRRALCMLAEGFCHSNMADACISSPLRPE